MRIHVKHMSQNQVLWWSQCAWDCPSFSTGSSCLRKPFNPRQTGMVGHPTWHTHTKPSHFNFIVSHRVPTILHPQTHCFLTREFSDLLKTSYSSLPFCPRNVVTHQDPHKLFIHFSAFSPRQVNPHFLQLPDCSHSHSPTREKADLLIDAK